MIEKVNNILKENKIGEIREGNLKIAMEEIEDGAVLTNRIEKFDAREGWICLTGKVILVDGSFDRNVLQNQTILSCELASGAQSLHIRQNDAGWMIWHLTREDKGDQLLLEETFFATPQAPGYKLKYEVFWQEDEVLGALRPFAGRFAGFEKGGKSR